MLAARAASCAMGVLRAGRARRVVSTRRASRQGAFENCTRRTEAQQARWDEAQAATAALLARLLARRGEARRAVLQWLYQMAVQAAPRTTEAFRMDLLGHLAMSDETAFNLVDLAARLAPPQPD